MGVKILKNKACRKSVIGKIMALSLALLMVPLLFTESAVAAVKTNGVYPTDSFQGKAITIGYCGEDYTTFTQILSGVCNALYEDGMLAKEPPKEFLSADACWNFISNNMIDDNNVIFDRNAFFDLTEMTEQQQQAMVRSPKADLMIVMGSLSAKLFVNSGYKGDYIVAGANNVFGLGVAHSASDSGFENRCAAIYDDVYSKQVQSVCQMFDFTQIGVVYEDSKMAFEYSGIPELRRQSEEKGFEIVERNLKELTTSESYPQYLADIKKLYQEMAQQVDAFYLTINQIHGQDLQDALKPFYDKKIPVISQQGSQEVKNGALFGISITDENNYGALLMDMITNYLSGQPLRYMSRVFQSAPKVSFNLSVAKKIDYPLDFKTMLICDDVY